VEQKRVWIDELMLSISDRGVNACSSQEMSVTASLCGPRELAGFAFILPKSPSIFLVQRASLVLPLFP
jgi:hypothetical protein